MKVFVTGAAGYIGSVTAEELVRAGHEVVAYDNLSSGHRAALPGNVPLVVGDILDGELLYRSLQDMQADAVLHFASEIVVSESYENPGSHFRTNVAGSLETLEAALRAGVPRFVFSSSAAVYGAPNVSIITEETPPDPVSPYGLSKLQVEQMLEWYGRVLGFQHASLRYFNACGATKRNGEDRPNETHLIPLLLDTVLGRRDPPFRLFGEDYATRDGTCVRDYVHVADIARAHILALEALDDLDGAVYNLGSGVGFTNREVIAAVERVTGERVPVEPAPRRRGDPDALVASNERARCDLGWEPKVRSIDAMVESAWKWRLDHPHGYANA
jgi:UDP-glucose 4-epimerase